jgi:hypothetical protein
VKITDSRPAQLDESTLDWLAARILDAVRREEPVSAAALQLLLRRMTRSITSAGDDLAEALGAALARELDRQARRGCQENCEAWIEVFSEAAAISDDPRLRSAAAVLLQDLRSRWASLHLGSVDEAMRAVGACLAAVHLAETHDMVTDAIDTLERVVGGAYRPGQGVSHQVAATFVRGDLSDHVCSASTLLLAFAVTGRLPYAMLAEEIIQSVLRNPPRTPDGNNRTFAVECDLASVFCRLAALHRDEVYRQTAILAVNEDYAEHAARTLTVLAASVYERGVHAAPFGLALAAHLELQ